jgi:formylglycine-generating enzyme required for sulfatase activity
MLSGLGGAVCRPGPVMEGQMEQRRYEAGELVVTENQKGPGVPTVVRCEWSYIPPWTFDMGSPVTDDEAYEDERPQHAVMLTRGFLLQRTPVTQEQWFAVMGTDPSCFKGPRRPVERVSWLDAVEYCNALSRLAGLPDSYVISPVRKSVRLVKNPKGYRLPTEAEWEYACRAGTTGVRYGQLDDVAWYKDNSGGETHEVGLKQPNTLGLYDMLGNVWEWTQDWYGSYSAAHQTNPQGPAEGSYRVNRGGSWYDDASFARAGYRYDGTPGDRNIALGFRPLRSLP